MLSAGLYLGATDVSNLHLKISECKCFWMLDFWNALSCAEGRGALTTFATALPQIINGGLGLERPHHCPAEKYTHQTSYFWPEGLHVVGFLFLPHPWISTGWYCIAWPFSVVQIIWGVSSADRWITLGYRKQHKVKCVFKPPVPKMSPEGLF